MEKQNIVVLGISTGGPKTLREFFNGFPLLDASIVLVQHMMKCANKSLCTTLNSVTKMEIKIACHGETMQPGVVYFAPSEVHLELRNNKIIQLVNGPKVCYVRPAVDVTMKSVRKTNEDNITGVIMTGMGKDGAEGISHIKSIGGVTYAQDENSSVIWGMPKAAIYTGNVDFVLTPIGIRNKLISQLGRLSD
ncbi:methylesterase [Candidatus Scalindua japonica]|uniref:protein-glutamate methylesterase n=1 Tax=Candidatus Scalindua japonica TaxID=1284222 RepID=A0A286TYW2_9BACT|nr:CheB methylesterase domain-containing protein [Candidatus Scalindua japonica]GAX61099.1 methylesterase [Candidatus Scalindua japonica]